MSDCLIKNKEVINLIVNHAQNKSKPLLNCLRAHHNLSKEFSYLDTVTDALVASSEANIEYLKIKAKIKCGDNEELAIKSSTNSIRRTSGVVYEHLVVWTIAKHLIQSNSSWYIEYPVSKEMKEFFSSVRYKNHDYPTSPDLDMMLRSPLYKNSNDEPLVLLSAKMSIADRGAGAAFWKQCLSQISEQKKKYRLCQGIIVSDTYKGGEIHTKQCANTTFVFDFRLTTKKDGELPKGWNRFNYIDKVLKAIDQGYVNSKKVPFKEVEYA